MNDNKELRCGFCSLPVDGKTIGLALESEAFESHPASLIGEPKSNGDQRVYQCNDGTGCNK